MEKYTREECVCVCRKKSILDGLVGRAALLEEGRRMGT